MNIFSPTSGSKDILTIGRYVVAIGLIIFGIQNFIYHDFIAGRAPSWPEGDTVKSIWVYFSGCVFIIAGVLLALGKHGRVYLILTALMVLVWALFRHIPVLVNIHFRWGGELTNAGKALTIFGGLLAATALLPQEHNGLASRLSGVINPTKIYTISGRYCMGIFLIICGYEHFLFVEFVKTLVPVWIPGDVFWTYFAGVALIAGGIGLCIPKTAPLAGLLTGIMIFIWFAILHLPRALSANDQNEWTAVAEAFIFSGIAFILTRRTDR